MKLDFTIGIAFGNGGIGEIEAAMAAETGDVRAEEKHLAAFGGLRDG